MGAAGMADTDVMPVGGVQHQHYVPVSMQMWVMQDRRRCSTPSLML